MDKKVLPGSLLLHNLAHGLMSNIETSLYLWDLSHCSNKLTKDILINWTISKQLKAQVFKKNPVIVVTTRNTRKDFHALAIGDKEISLKVGEIQVGKIYVHEELIVIDASPSCHQNSIYQLLKSEAAEAKGSLLLDTILEVQKHLKIGRSSLVIDGLHTLFLINQASPQRLLKQLKQINLQQKTLFPFHVFCDFSLLQGSDLAGDFETLVKKAANGLIRIDKQVGNLLLVYASAVKPGQRFTDEQGVINLSGEHGVRLEGNENEQLMAPFVGLTKVEKATKDIAMKSTFKIEMTEKEKAERDKHAQSIYHMGEGMKASDQIFKGKPIISLEKEDQEEIHSHNLKVIAEEGQRESSDDGDGEDPDDDLDF